MLNNEKTESLNYQVSLFPYSELVENSIFNVSLKELTLIPEFFLAFSAITIITHCSLIAYNKKYNSPLIQFSVTSLSILILFLTFLLYLNEELITIRHLSFEFSFLTDSLGFVSKVITITTSLFCMYLLQDYIIEYKINNTEYDLLMLYSVLGLTMLLTANDFGTIFLAIELQSLSLYMLAGFKKNSIYSIESGQKYFILGALSASYFLLDLEGVFCVVVFILIFANKSSYGTSLLSESKKFLDYCALFLQLTPEQLHQVEITQVLQGALQLLDELGCGVGALDSEALEAAKEAIKKLYYDGGDPLSISKKSLEKFSPSLLDHEYEEVEYLEKIRIVREKISYKQSINQKNSGSEIRSYSELEALDRLLKAFLDSRIDKRKAEGFLAYDPLYRSNGIQSCSVLARRLEWSRETVDLIVYLFTGFMFDCMLMLIAYIVTFFPPKPKE
jgi:hypothetical protein